jgi:hypothetical protein
MHIRLPSTISRALILAVGLAFSSIAAATDRRTAAFVHVNVVPMDRERVLTDQTVLIENGIVSAIGRDLQVPPGAQVIDGAGQYLSPGLADMHSHSDTREDMKVYLANGVTTILNLGGASSDFVDQLLPLLNRGERPGPHVYAALRIDGTPRYGQLVVKTPDEARWAVRLAKTNGYSFMKVYNNLSPAAFEAAATEARKLQLGMAGHHLEAVPLSREIGGGNFLIAHLEEIIYGLFEAPTSDPLAAPPPSTITQAVSLLKRNHAFVVADLITFETIAQQWGKPEVAAAFLSSPDAKYVPFNWRLSWQREDYEKRKGSLGPRVQFIRQLTKALDDAGIPMVAGTDAPTIPGIVPGFSLHDNLDRLVSAGLTPFEALATATRTAGDLIDRSIPDTPRFGQVRPGYRADLILSAANPLKSLETLREPEGVMSHGRWYSRSELQQILGGVATDYSAAARPSN